MNIEDLITKLKNKSSFFNTTYSINEPLITFTHTTPSTTYFFIINTDNLYCHFKYSEYSLSYFESFEEDSNFAFLISNYLKTIITKEFINILPGLLL